MRRGMLWGLCVVMVGSACKGDQGAPEASPAASSPSAPGARPGDAAAAEPEPVPSRLRELLEQAHAMPPARVAAALASLDEQERLTLSTHAALGSAVYRIACQAEPDLVAVLGGVQTNCVQLGQEYAQAVQLIGAQAVSDNAELERTKVLNAYKCQSGEIDAASCQAWRAAGQMGAAAIDDTNRRIGENIGDRCRVGVDPGCVP